MKLRVSIALGLCFTLLLIVSSNALALSGTVGDFSASAKTKRFSAGKSRGLLVTTVTLKGLGLLQGRPQIKCKGCKRLKGKRYSRSKFYRTTVKFRNANLIVLRGKSMTIRLVSNDKNVAGRFITLSLKLKGKLRLRQTGYGCIDGGGKTIACPTPAKPTRESHPPLYLFGDQACENSPPAPWVGYQGSATITALSSAGVAAVGSGYCSVHPLAPVGGEKSVTRDVQGQFRAGQEFTYSTWLRSSDGQQFCGNLTLWAMGSTNDKDGNTPFCVGAQWTPVSTSLRTTKDYPQLRAQIYLGASASDLLFDGASLTTQLVNSSFESGSPAPWSDFANPGVSVATFSVPGIATDGSSFLSAKAAAANHSFAQDVSANPMPGQSFTASIWLRSASGASVNARLALHSLDGVAPEESGSSKFVLDGTWRKYSATLVPTAPGSRLRFEVYLDTANAEVFADDAQLYLN